MRHLLQVLIQALARCFQVCAELLSAFGRAANPAPGEGLASPAFSGRAAGPPDDWARWASPPPPAHWVDLVQRRAPGFLGRKSEAPVHRNAVLRPVLALRVEKNEPPLPAPESRRSPAAAVRAPETALRKAACIPAFPLPPQSGRVPGAPAGKGSRPIRIVTVIQERPRRKPGEDPAVARGTGDPEIPECRIADDAPGRTFPERNPETVLPSPGNDPDAPAPAPNDRRPAKGESELFPNDRGSWDPGSSEPLPGPLPESSIPSRFQGSPALPVPCRSPGLLRKPLPELLVFPSDSRKSGPRESSKPSAEAARWPELSASPEREENEDARLLCRELRRQAVLEDEQRGIPWNA